MVYFSYKVIGVPNFAAPFDDVSFSIGVVEGISSVPCLSMEKNPVLRRGCGVNKVLPL